mmetsp:Transcript_73752/g.108256  ORF Transcript_73752/g.108256 Transcript_73752/m.108256 type:complete len:130 (+) Transcript_73752:3-392(+)
MHVHPQTCSARVRLLVLHMHMRTCTHTHILSHTLTYIHISTHIYILFGLQKTIYSVCLCRQSDSENTAQEPLELSFIGNRSGYSAAVSFTDIVSVIQNVMALFTDDTSGKELLTEATFGVGTRPPVREL